MAAFSKLCAAGVVYAAEEDAVVVVPGRDEAILKSEQRQMMQLEVEEDVVRHGGL